MTISSSSNSSPFSVNFHGNRIMTNTMINLFGLGIPYLVGFFSIPFIVHGLGDDRFGILSILWIVIGYFGLVDLGLGRATTKFIAEFLGKNQRDRIPVYVSSTIWMQLVLGVLGTIVFFFLIPWIVEHLLKTPPIYWEEARKTFFIVAFSLPIILLSSSFRGILEAAQRFDLVNAVKVPASIAFYVLPLIGIVVGFKLPGIVLLLVLSRLAALLAWIILSLKLFPDLKKCLIFDRHVVKSLIKFGGWVSLSGILYNLTSSVDRFLIGGILGTKQITYYTAPYEAISKLGIIPGSISMMLFPAFSSLDGMTEEMKLRSLYAKSMRYILLSIGPLMVFAMVFSEPFLKIWLGPAFVEKSVWAFRILAAGFLFTSLAGVPFNFLQGIGRVDLATKLQVIELGLFIPLAWIMIQKWGINGAAIAMVVKSSVVTILYFFQAYRIRGIGFKDYRIHGVFQSVFFVAFSALVTILSKALFRSSLVGFISALIVVGVVGFLFAVNKEERNMARGLIHKVLGKKFIPRQMA